MLGRSVEIKGRETAGISSNWESLELLHVLTNVTRILWSPSMKGELYSQHSSSTAAVPGECSHAPLHAGSRAPAAQILIAYN